MERKYYKIVGLLFGIVGLIVFIMNVVTPALEYDTSGTHAVVWWNYIILVLGVVLIIISVIKKEELVIKWGSTSITLSFERINKWIQFLIPFLFSVLSILAAYENPWAMQLIFVAGLIGLKHRLIARRGLIITLSIFIIAFGYSAYAAQSFFGGLFALIFGVFFFGTLAILYTDELNRFFKLSRESHDKLISVSARLKKYEAETLEPQDFPFTPREREILEMLCKTHGSNQAIGDKLGIKIFTVKSHIKNIFDKSGVDDRHQLIDLFKHAYVD